MKAKSEYLKPLTGEVIRSPFAAIDLETKSGRSQRKGFTRPFLAGYYDGNQYLETRGKNCVAEMLEIMFSPRRVGWIYYAHNGGKFDWLHFLPMIKKAGYQVEILHAGSAITMVSVRERGSKKAQWRLLDSVKILPMKLEKAAKVMGVENKLASFDLDTHESDPRWSKYLEQDCRTLFQVVDKFHELVEIELGGEVGITAASTSMKTFRRGYLNRWIARHEDTHDLARAAYYGGRVEIYRERAKGLRYYDINSSYPRSMLEPIPCGDCYQVPKGKPPEWLRRGRVGFAEAVVHMPSTINVPPLPVRDTETGRLIFPVGILKGTWAAIELERAEEMGATVQWGKSVWYDSAPVLRPYVEALYSYRDKSRPDYSEGLSTVAKLLMNSLYGKFGTKVEKETLIWLEPGQSPQDGWRSARPGDDECTAYYVPATIEADYVIPQIAAHITALSRLALHDLLLEADRLGVLAYCDTDSVITTADLSHLCGSELGQIKDEGEGEIFRGEFILPKFYRLKGNRGTVKLGMKGYRKKDERTFLRARRGETVSSKSLEKIGSLARRNFASGPEMRTVARKIISTDQKRLHNIDGTTAPLYVDHTAPEKSETRKKRKIS